MTAIESADADAAVVTKKSKKNRKAKKEASATELVVCPAEPAVIVATGTPAPDAITKSKAKKDKTNKQKKTAAPDATSVETPLCTVDGLKEEDKAKAKSAAAIQSAKEKKQRKRDKKAAAAQKEQSVDEASIAGSDDAKSVSPVTVEAVVEPVAAAAVAVIVEPRAEFVNVKEKKSKKAKLQQKVQQELAEKRHSAAPEPQAVPLAIATNAVAAVVVGEQVGKVSVCFVD